MTTRVSIVPGIGLAVERGQHQSVLPRLGPFDDTVSSSVSGTANLSGQQAAMAGGTLAPPAYVYASFAQFEAPSSTGSSVTLPGKSVSAVAGALRAAMSALPAGIGAQLQFTSFSSLRGYVSWAQLETPQSVDKIVILSGVAAATVKGTMPVSSGTPILLIGQESTAAAGVLLCESTAVLSGQSIATLPGALQAGEENYVYSGVTVAEVGSVLVGQPISLVRGAISIVADAFNVGVLDGAVFSMNDTPPEPEITVGALPMGVEVAMAVGSIVAEVDTPSVLDGVAISVQYGDFSFDRAVVLAGVDLSIVAPRLTFPDVFSDRPDFFEIENVPIGRLGKPLVSQASARLG